MSALPLTILVGVAVRCAAGVEVAEGGCGAGDGFEGQNAISLTFRLKGPIQTIGSAISVSG